MKITHLELTSLISEKKRIFSIVNIELERLKIMTLTWFNKQISKSVVNWKMHYLILISRLLIIQELNIITLYMAIISCQKGFLKNLFIDHKTVLFFYVPLCSRKFGKLHSFSKIAFLLNIRITYKFRSILCTITMSKLILKNFSQ